MKQSTKEITIFSIADVTRANRMHPFLDKDFIVEAPVKSLNQRDLIVGVVKNKVMFVFGCKTVKLEEIKEEYEILSAPKPITYLVKTLKNKDTKKRASTSPVVDESAEYYITASKKAFDKKDYYVVDETLVVKSKVIEKTGYNSGMYYDGYNLGRKDYVLDEMKSLIELGDAILEFLKDKK